jgi:hypothetical protein
MPMTTSLRCWFCPASLPGWHYSAGRGLATFDLLHSSRHNHAAVLCAFDLLELDGKDLRRATKGLPPT